jgi:alkylation response protein AidB-like acyl-CoA dehydrogenase
MTSGAGRLLSQHLPRLPPSHPLHLAFKRITAREDYWVSSQWMTERPGGSDVQNTETVATYSPLPSKTGENGNIDEGDYLVSGFKYFSSATDCNVAFMLAKTESGKLSLFFAPTRKTATGLDGQEKEVTNGVRIHRLKNKFGTKELPTAELELKDVRAHLIGPLDRGIPTIAALLNVTRTHNFITALSCWRRALSISKSFAKERTTINQPLWTFPMHLRLLSGMELKHRGLLHLSFFTTALLSFTDNGFPENPPEHYAPLPRPGEEAKVVLRTLTATGKATVCKLANINLMELQESMGGVGYMDEPDEPEFNISRLLRDTSANAIWEGTTNVLSSEVVRHLLRGNNLDVFDDWLRRAINAVDDKAFNKALRHSWTILQSRLDGNKGQIATALADGRQILFSLAWVISGTLLALDAQRDADELAKEVARRWLLDDESGVGEFAFPDVVFANHTQRGAHRVEERGNWDCRLVWGVDLPKDAAAGYRAETESIASKL